MRTSAPRTGWPGAMHASRPAPQLRTLAQLQQRRAFDDRRGVPGAWQCGGGVAATPAQWLVAARRCLQAQHARARTDCNVAWRAAAAPRRRRRRRRQLRLGRPSMRSGSASRACWYAVTRAAAAGVARLSCERCCSSCECTALRVRAHTRRSLLSRRSLSGRRCRRPSSPRAATRRCSTTFPRRGLPLHATVARRAPRRRVAVHQRADATQRAETVARASRWQWPSSRR